MKTIEELNALDADGFVARSAPLFEGAPRFVRRLADARPFESEDELIDAARATAREMPEEEQIELLNSHPRIGADPPHSRISPAASRATMRRRAGPRHGSARSSPPSTRPTSRCSGSASSSSWPAARAPTSSRSSSARSTRIATRSCVAAWTTSCSSPSDRLDDLHGPRPLREELRESIALEISRWMVGEIDRDGLIRATHRLIEEGVESPALLALSLADQDERADLGTADASG